MNGSNLAHGLAMLITKAHLQFLLLIATVMELLLRREPESPGPGLALSIDTGDGFTYTFAFGGSIMDQTISGKSVGDKVKVIAGPAVDARGKVIADPSTVFDFSVSDPNVLGLEIAPPDIPVSAGQMAARVTVLDVAADAMLTVTMQRPGKTPLTATCHFPSISPETLAAATDFTLDVEDDVSSPGGGGGGGGGGDIPPPTGPDTGPATDIPAPGGTTAPTAGPTDAAARSRSVRGNP